VSYCAILLRTVAVHLHSMPARAGTASHWARAPGLTCSTASNNLTSGVLRTEKKLVALGLKRPEDGLNMVWPAEISLQAAIDAAKPPYAEEQDNVPWRLQAGEVCDADWLNEHDFHAKKRVERTWTEADVRQLEQGLVRLQRGEDLPPSESTGPLYYLSHHVMQKKFSAQACARQVMSMYSRSYDVQAVQLPDGLADDMAAKAAEMGLGDDGDTDESGDEAIL
jgi:hypothetical protein